MEQDAAAGRPNLPMGEEEGRARVARGQIAPHLLEALGRTAETAEPFSLGVRLRQLRQRAVYDCRSATLQVGMASACMLLFFLIGWVLSLAGLNEALDLAQLGHNARYAGPEIWQVVLTSMVCLFTPAVIYYLFNIVRNTPHLSAWAYQDCLRGIVHHDYGLLFTDEGLQLALRDIQHEHWSETLLPQQRTTSIEAMLELAAQNFPAARLLPGGTERQIRGYLLARRWRKRREFFFRMPLGLRILLAIFWPIGLPLALVGTGTLTFLGPDFICARARLAAFIDHYLDEHKVDAQALGPPEETPTWWMRLTAPWRSRVKPGLK